MNERVIDGNLFQTILICGLNNLKDNMETVNDLNVFPIPDGDTGYNMYATFSGGCRSIREGEFSLGQAAETAGNGMLMSARGNSGVILSQMFAGIAQGLKGVENADVICLGRAFECGVKYAYSAVAEPVEGTMLTVLREATAYAVERIGADSSVESFFADLVCETERSLERTPELLPVLKEAGVIDSGGAGVLYILQGILNALRGGKPVWQEVAATVEQQELDLSSFNEDSVMEFGYCTEFLLQLTNAKTDIPTFSLEAFKAHLSSVGDSLVVFQTGTVVKVHIHTMNPGGILQFAQNYGEFLTLKIENMMLQHNETLRKKAQEQVFRRNSVRKRFAVVAVANGQGMKDAFSELGADIVIDDAKNSPSVELFLKAFDAANADYLFVLPDDANEFLAAREAAGLCRDSQVRVIPTKSMGDCYVVLASLDFESDDAEEIARHMEADIESSVCATVTRAIRRASCRGVEVEPDDYVGIVGKEILVSTRDKVQTATELVERLHVKKNFVIAFYGKDVTDGEKKAFATAMKEIAGDMEFYELSGGQELYDFVIVLQ